MRPTERNDAGRLWLLQRLLFWHEEGVYSLADLADLFGVEGNVKRWLRKAERVRDGDLRTLKAERFNPGDLRKANSDPIALAEAKRDRLRDKLSKGDPWAESEPRRLNDDLYEELEPSRFAGIHEGLLPA
jgi:hypothetical protein